MPVLMNVTDENDRHAVPPGPGKHYHGRMATLRKPSCSPILNVMLGRDPSNCRGTKSGVIERANRVRPASDARARPEHDGFA
jgi:hypothetical protein